MVIRVASPSRSEADERLQQKDRAGLRLFLVEHGCECAHIRRAPWTSPVPRSFKAGLLLLVVSNSLLWSRVHQTPVGWHLIAQLSAALWELKVADSLNVWSVLLLSDFELPPALKEVLERPGLACQSGCSNRRTTTAWVMKSSSVCHGYRRNTFETFDKCRSFLAALTLCVGF